jgi:hypothetical protein
VKQFLFVSILLFITLSNTYSQDRRKLNRNTPIWRGNIALKDGNGEQFRNLDFKRETVIYKDMKGNTIEKNISDVFIITKRGSYAGYGALVGCLSGVLASLQTESAVIDGRLPKADGRGAIYLGITAGCTVVGGLVGLIFNKDKTVYRSDSPMTFAPLILSSPDGRKYAGLSFKKNF